MLLTKLLVGVQTILYEIGLWTLFIVAIITGWVLGGLWGAVLGISLAFLFTLFFVAPFLVILDMRDCLKNIETMKIQEHKQQ